MKTHIFHAHKNEWDRPTTEQIGCTERPMLTNVSNCLKMVYLWSLGFIEEIFQ